MERRFMISERDYKPCFVVNLTDAERLRAIQALHAAGHTGAKAWLYCEAAYQKCR